MDIIRKDRCPDNTPGRDQNEIKLFPEINPHSRRVLNNLHSSNGLNDRVSIHIATGLTTSLKLISVDALTLSVFSSGGAFGDSKRRVQAQFRFAEKVYHLWVTDPRCER